VRFRADVALREGIELVAADRENAVPFDLDVDATGGLAKRADAVNGVTVGHDGYLVRDVELASYHAHRFRVIRYASGKSRRTVSLRERTGKARNALHVVCS
jgi:hypothetical protein